MAKLDTQALTEKAIELHGLSPDPSGDADYVGEKGQFIVAGDPSEFKAAFKRLKMLKGYRWIVINREDLFGANTLSIGSKAGILDADGNVLKNADIPRKKV